jgi:hypothetical protein
MIKAIDYRTDLDYRTYLLIFSDVILININ